MTKISSQPETQIIFSETGPSCGIQDNLQCGLVAPRCDGPNDLRQSQKKRGGGVSCGEVHSQAREMVKQGYTATLVAATLAISRSSLYYRKKPRGSRADRSCDEQIVVACGEQRTYGYRRVAWWLWRKKVCV
jgi:hypothetical protein